jgi:ABC-2 type transport system ATP-binding protein
MNDVSALVERLILIDKGRIRFDGTLTSFTEKFAGGRRLVVRGPTDLSSEGLVRAEDGSWCTVGSAEEINRVLHQVLTAHPTADVTVADPPLEEVLTAAFGSRDAESPAETAP